MKAIVIVTGVLCSIACLAAGFIYIFDFGNKPLSIESTFWAMPLICPAAYGVYLKWKRIGTVAQALLYSLATVGAYEIV